MMTLSAAAAVAEGQVHKVAIHVDENDPQIMNMALNNVANLTSYYEDQGDSVMVELVAYGPGLNMFVAETSPVADRIAAMSLEMENLTFSACGNTLAAMQTKVGHDIALLSEATVVPSGVVQLISLQEQGYAYVRP
jgi:intracellular sulfur oxidation DsrE/DsrF family protein